MLTIDEIKKRKMEGKRKWGSSLIHFIKEKLDEDLPIDAIVIYLKETYNFSVKIGDLYSLKSKYYIPISKNGSDINLLKSPQNSLQPKTSTIAQNPKPSIAEKIYNDIYKPKNQETVFDFGDDF
jgi:IS30 family transposase